MKLLCTKRTRAFTLMELLIVIAIMAVLAALVVGLAGVAGEKQKLSRARAEGDRIAMMIETYRLKLGVYPPRNPDLTKPERNSLIYELAGAVRKPVDPPVYETPWGDVTAADLMAEFGVSGIINSSDDRTEVKRILKGLKPDQYVETGNKMKRLVIPIDDANGSRPNFWQYLSPTNATDSVTNKMRNSEAFDLWVDMKIGRLLGSNKVVTIGNWKD